MTRPSKEAKSYLAQQLFEGQYLSLPVLATSCEAPTTKTDIFLPAIMIQRARVRRPTKVIQFGEDVLSYCKLFWDISDFEEYLTLGLVRRDIHSLLVETSEAEKSAVWHFPATGRLLGEQISVEGCRAVGLPENSSLELIQEMVQGGELLFNDFKGDGAGT